MWTFGDFGYFSVIEHRKDKDLLLVRSRVKGDLERLKEKFLPNLGKILETPIGADYPYRALAWRTDYAEAMRKAVMDIGYTNFKSNVSKTQGSARHDLYMRVWMVMKSAEATMLRMEQDEANRAKAPKQESWLGYHDNFSVTRDDGRFGGKGAKKSYQRRFDMDALDFDASRKARNKRLGLSGISEHMLKHDKERAEAQRVSELVAKQLKGTEHDFDRGFEDPDETPPSDWVDSDERFIRGLEEAEESLEAAEEAEALEDRDNE